MCCNAYTDYLVDRSKVYFAVCGAVVQWLALLPYSKSIFEYPPRSWGAEFPCSPYAHMSISPLLWLPPTVQIHESCSWTCYGWGMDQWFCGWPRMWGVLQFLSEDLAGITTTTAFKLVLALISSKFPISWKILETIISRNVICASLFINSLIK